MMLELRNICKTYLQGRMEVPVLKGISLSVEEGEYLAIMGPSGSGKTTLMNIIGCLDNPSSGEYLLGDENIAQVSERRMSEVRLHSIGFVFQSFYLLSRQSALENVALPLLYAGVRRRERQEIARRALERVGLGDRTNFKPTQLSGGQCQRVAIARAIVNNPKIILADEPTGALDTTSGQQIMEIFQSLNDEGATIVMITHEPEIAAHAKRTLHIRDGLLLGGAGQPLPELSAHGTPPPPPAGAGALPLSAVPAPAAHPAGKPAGRTAAPQQAAKPAPARPPQQAQNVYGKIPAPGKAPESPAPRREEEPISGQSIIAALERQLDALKQENTSAGGEGSAHE
ncbi:ABC transporter ATP-binding protein [Acutalibacter caecimuris]|uniref:ABC transporter ATP-binding protein n=1 Tax=Acutalibacter caecimuris TaxID=3093657 RepID=UPI0034612673